MGWSVNGGLKEQNLKSFYASMLAIARVDTCYRVSVHLVYIHPAIHLSHSHEGDSSKRKDFLQTLSKNLRNWLGFEGHISKVNFTANSCTFLVNTISSERFERFSLNFPQMSTQNGLHIEGQKSRTLHSVR